MCMKKRYSIFSNVVYVCMQIHNWDKSALPLYLITIPCGVIIGLASNFVAPILIWEIEKSLPYTTICFTILGITIVMILINIISNRLRAISAHKRVLIAKKYDLLLCEKILDMDYELIEGPTCRTKYQKAKNSLQNDQICSFIEAVADLLQNTFGFVGLCTVIVLLNPIIILLLFLAYGIQIGIDFFQQKYVHQKIKDNRARIDRHLNYITKSARDFNSAKDIRLYKMTSFFQKLSKHLIKENAYWINKLFQSYFIADMIGIGLNLLVTGGVYAYMINKLCSDAISVSQIVLYLSAVLGFKRWISGVTHSFDKVNEGSLAVCDIREFLDIKNRMHGSNSTIVSDEKFYPGDIEIRDLCYKYEGSENTVLHNINLKIRAGERIAVVGENGAGKTTLVKILCGLYSASSGTVLINGEDTSTYNRDEYYKLFSVVFQDVRVMPVSIASNVSMKTDEHTDVKQVVECLKMAGIYESILKLPDGINTKLVKSVNEDAVELSGGELQKLILARAICKDTPYIILDEPTAALDPIAENEMYLRYNELTKGRTAIYISHRLSSTRFCDRIIYLENGQIIEEGTHDVLMAMNGRYAEMFSVQSKYYKQEDIDVDKS